VGRERDVLRLMGFPESLFLRCVVAGFSIR
jgi:hypothetical protein